MKQLPKELSQRLQQSFDKLFYYHPEKRATICLNQDEVPVYRWQRSFGQVPPRQSDSGFYMFHGGGAEEAKVPTLEGMEIEFQHILDWANRERPEQSQYNQVTVCWYEGPEDYIAPHKDMYHHLDSEAGVMVVNLCKHDRHPRTMNILANGRGENAHLTRVDVRLTHGRVIRMSGQHFQRYFKHGVAPVSSGYPGPRIALSLRCYKYPAQKAQTGRKNDE